MAVPKKKTSKCKRNMRRSHDHLAIPGYVECSNCGENMRPHHVCGACGHYNKREVISFKEEVEETAQEV
jgi:large subunit ribosomal protein L32